jgi:hypothetical protein
LIQVLGSGTTAAHGDFLCPGLNTACLKAK